MRRRREHCYRITDDDGRVVDVRAAVPPSLKAQAALLNLFDAARKHLATLPDADACAHQRFAVVKRTEFPKP
jgi:hypothetical protein